MDGLWRTCLLWTSKSNGLQRQRQAGHAEVACYAPLQPRQQASKAERRASLCGIGAAWVIPSTSLDAWEGSRYSRLPAAVEDLERRLGRQGLELVLLGQWPMGCVGRCSAPATSA